MLERQIILKQSEEHQRQKGLQESDDPRQPSLKHDKYALLNTGIRVRDPSQMFMFGDTNWVRGSSNPPLTHSHFLKTSLESAGSFTKHISQQAGKSFIGSQTSGSVNQKSANLGSAAVLEASDLVKSVNHPKPRLYNISPNFPALSSSGNAFELLQKVGTKHTYSISINQVPRSESDDALTPSYLNKPSQSPKCENNRLSDQNCMKSHLVSVKKKEDGQTWSTQPAKIQLDARVEQSPSVTESCEIPSTSYAAVSRIRNTSPVPLQQLDVAKQKAGSLKSKKRKFSAFESLPWHEEVTEAPSRLHDISSAELVGKHSVVGPSKKLKKLSGDAAHSSWINQKRRLDLTIQLMERLFQSPPATVLSQDAIYQYDTVAYYASRLALVDACSLCVEARRNMTSKSSSFQDLSKTIERFVDRSKRVEDAVSRLEKNRSSIREVQMDFQGLETFSISNRLAKFHLRRPMVTRDKSTPAMRKHDPQKYVKVHPMPKTVPGGDNCLSL